MHRRPWSSVDDLIACPGTGRRRHRALVPGNVDQPVNAKGDESKDNEEYDDDDRDDVVLLHDCGELALGINPPSQPGTTQRATSEARSEDTRAGVEG